MEALDLQGTRYHTQGLGSESVPEQTYEMFGKFSQNKPVFLLIVGMFYRIRPHMQVKTVQLMHPFTARVHFSLKQNRTNKNTTAVAARTENSSWINEGLQREAEP